jgi:hypothetical protein
VVVPAFYIAEQHPVLFWGAVLGAMFFIAWGIDRIGWLRTDGLGETFVLVVIVTACLWWVWAVVAFLVSMFLDIDIEPY